MLATRLFSRCQPLRRAFSLSAATVGETPLPWYPPAVARERKSVINSAVVGTPVGATPPIPPKGYLDEEHHMWSLVYDRVHKLAKEHACFEYMQALTQGAEYDPLKIPDVKQISERLERKTGWRIAPVTGSLSALDFFSHLDAGRMPCTMYIRPHTKYAFTEDPDCVHEMLGHIPALFIPSWSRCYRAFGETAERLTREGKTAQLEQLTLMYFAVVEKGLVREGGPDGPVKAREHPPHMPELGEVHVPEKQQVWVLAVASMPRMGGGSEPWAAADKLRRRGAAAATVTGDIRAVQPLVHLTDLRLDDTAVSGDIQAVQALVKLTALYLDGTKVSGDIKAVQRLVNLTELWLNGTQVFGDIQAVQSLVNLTKLVLTDTQASGDVNTLSVLEKLTDLDLRQTQVWGDKAAVRDAWVERRGLDEDGDPNGLFL